MDLGDDFMATGDLGLGFVTMRKLCAAMGGNVTIESEHGLPPRVRLRFDVQYDDDDAAATQSPRPEPTSGSAAAHVLLVEDNVTSAKIAQLMLSGIANVTVIRVEDGAAALAAVGIPDPSTKAADFSLVLMDVTLPDLVNVTRLEIESNAILGRERSGEAFASSRSYDTDHRHDRDIVTESRSGRYDGDVNETLHQTAADRADHVLYQDLY